MKKIAVLISNKGSGTNLRAIIKGVKEKKIKGNIIIVVSDTEDAPGLVQAKKHSLITKICQKKEDLLPLLLTYNPDLICLCGWKQIIDEKIITMFPNRILNIHPGLIPDNIDDTVKNPDGTKALWNRKKFTDSAIKQFLDTKATYAGSSVHFLTSDFDFGKVLGRCFEKVLPNDTITSLYQRVKKKENKIYVSALKKLCSN